MHSSLSRKWAIARRDSLPRRESRLSYKWSHEMRIAALKEQRAAKVDALRAIVAKAESEKRDLNETEAAAFNTGNRNSAPPSPIRPPRVPMGAP